MGNVETIRSQEKCVQLVKEFINVSKEQDVIILGLLNTTEEHSEYWVMIYESILVIQIEIKLYLTLTEVL